VCPFSFSPNFDLFSLPHIAAKHETRETIIHHHNSQHSTTPLCSKTRQLMSTMAARTSGNKIVMAAVGATVSAVGIGTIYLPFVADKDKMRGLHEEQTPPTSSMLAQEIKKLQKDGVLRGDDDDGENSAKPDRKSLAPGSMWKRF
jgi:hypothetical protein